MQHEHGHVPVTALAFYKDKCIFSGQGTTLNIYSADFKRLLHRACIFEAQTIHGIVVLDSLFVSTIVLWGGPLFRPIAFALKDGAVSLILGEIQSTKDWILDVAFAPRSQPLAGIVTAHNSFSTVHISQPQNSWDQRPDAALECRVPGSNCILYSAHLIWLSPSQCLIASGTCFGDVVVWSAILGLQDDAPAQSQIHYSFSAHEGSVFGVQLSADLDIPDLESKRTLLSCSDDRTIRLWDVSNLDSIAPTPLHQATGFGSNLIAERHAPRCLANAMGHISRIWRVFYAQAGPGGNLMQIYSFGEDASVITWALKTDSTSYVLTPVRTARAHAGKNIWAVAINLQSNLLATGGADGAIALYNTIGSIDLVRQIPSPELLHSNKRDNYRAYDFVGPETLICTTDLGGVLLVELPELEDEGAVAEISGPLHGLRAYSFVSAIPSRAFIGGTDGVVYIYAHATRRLSEFATVDGKISSLFVQQHASSQIALLACTVKSTVASFFVIENAGDGCPDIRPSTSMQLELTPGFVTTSFAHHVDENQNFAVLGSRNGSIAIYAYSGLAQQPLSCGKLSTEVHGKEAVTALQWIRSADESGDCEGHFLFSTGRDGTFAVHVVRLLEAHIELDLAHQLPLPFGPNIEGFQLLGKASTMVWGFRSKEFIMYDLATQREIMTIECGGVHRNWSIQPRDKGGRFVWTKASQLFQATQSSLPYELIKPGGHGREIKAVAVLFDGKESVIATGAEDTNIKLFMLDKHGFQCLQTLRKHNTGIQDLAWHGRYLFSSGGFEEFFVWKASEDIPHVGVGVVCESMHPRSGTSDLRVMGFDVCEATEQQNFVVTMAYSDSTLKRWHYFDRTWQLIAFGDYLTACLTDIFRLGKHGHSLMTAATDGHVARWTFDTDERTMKWTDRRKIHQSAIHALAIAEVTDDTSLILTGGDDNAVGITRIDGDDDVRTLLIPRAHAAAVTGLVAIPLSKSSYYLVSTSIDQRVKLWKLEIDITRSGVDGIEVRQLQDHFTAVADVSSLEFCFSEGGGAMLLVCGVGMDLWHLPLPHGAAAPKHRIEDDDHPASTRPTRTLSS